MDVHWKIWSGMDLLYASEVRETNITEDEYEAVVLFPHFQSGTLGVFLELYRLKPPCI